MRGARPASIWILALVGALCLGSSCGTPTFIVQQYPGPARSAETIAIIRVDGGGKAQLLSLDREATDARVTPDARLHIEILPGNHSLWVQNLAAEGAAQSLTFRAEAGKVYRVEFVFESATSAFSPHIYEVDRGSNALKADVTALQAPSSEAQPPQLPRRPAPPAPVIVEQSGASPSAVDAGAPADAGSAADGSAPSP